MTNPPLPKRRPRQRAVPQPKLQTSILNHKNDHITREIERGLMQTKEYKVNEKTNQLLYIHEFDAPKRGAGEIKLLISGLAEQAHEKMSRALDSLGDACRDTFVALTAIGIQKHGTDKMCEIFPVTVDEILDTCGKQRSNGSFNPEARAEVIKHIKTLSQTKIQFSMPTTKQVKRGRKWVWENSEIKVIGPIIVYSGTIGEYSRVTGKELWEVQYLALGQWAKFVDNKVTTKIVPQQVLAYSAKRESYQKRLGHYLSELFRNNARESKGVLPHGITMRALFEGAQIEPERERKRFKTEVDKALEQLKQDGVIGNYWYMTKKNSPKDYEIVNGHRGRWFDTYLGLFINFSPPDATLEHYKNIAKKEDLAEEKGS